MNHNQFVLRKLRRAQFLSPAITTEAIKLLVEEMNVHFAGKERAVDDKPTCMTCFDMSGSGKTTTIQEAAKKANFIRAPISLIDNKLFAALFQSCRKFGSRLDPPLVANDLVEYDVAEEYMSERFDIVLGQLFQSIIEKLEIMNPNDAVIEVSMPKYISPTSSAADIRTSKIDIQELYQKVIGAMKSLNRLLVIHLDDCQEFFCGSTKNPQKTSDNKIRVGDVMCFALRLFSRRVSALGKCCEVLWVFSGTRPTLYLEMKVASSFAEPYDIAKNLRDFKIGDIYTVLSSYFRLGERDEVLMKRIVGLCGPPKLLYWFILTAEQHKLTSIADLTSLWDKIEDGAIGLYSEQIESTIKSFGLLPENLEIYARNLCLLHTHGFINNDLGFLEFNTLPSNWLPFIEAGLIRCARNGKWKLYPPNRFLVKIFNRSVKWFNWDNIQHLVAAIKTSESVTTVNGKVFEFLFALELCSLSDSTLWQKLWSTMKLQQMPNWSPSIAIMDHVNNCVNPNIVYIMRDPDRNKLKTDVVFFALSSSVPVRVLCQLTVQTKNSTTKANEALQEMLKITGVDGMNDCRIFLAPKSCIQITQTYKENYNDNECYFFDRKTFASMMQLPLDFCDPSQTSECLKKLLNFALDYGDLQSAVNITAFLPENGLKRKREEFGDMEEFYEALHGVGLNEGQMKKIRDVFVDHEIIPSVLSTLTDEKLKEAGVKQLGLREAILKVLGSP